MILQRSLHGGSSHKLGDEVTCSCWYCHSVCFAMLWRLTFVHACMHAWLTVLHHASNSTICTCSQQNVHTRVPKWHSIHILNQFEHGLVISINSRYTWQNHAPIVYTILQTLSCNHILHTFEPEENYCIQHYNFLLSDQGLWKQTKCLKILVSHWTLWHCGGAFHLCLTPVYSATALQ